MSCAHCGAADQRGRFCVGCGKHLPIPAIPRHVRLAPRALDETQPVLRFRVRPRVAVEDQPAAIA
jgi:hypothetical protein